MHTHAHTHAEAAIAKQWPRGSRWEDDRVGPLPYDTSLAECLMRDGGDM